MEAVGHSGRVSLALREALSCERMYRDRACAASWSKLGKDDYGIDPALRDIEQTCRRACIRDSGGSPLRGCIDPGEQVGDDAILGRVVTLDRALLQQAGLAPAEAEALSLRALMLGSTGKRRGTLGGTASVDPDDDDDVIDVDGFDDPPPPPPPRPPPPPSGTLVVEVGVADIRIRGDIVPLDQLQSTISGLRDRLGITRVEVQGDSDAPYARLVEVLDAVRASGVDDVSLSQP